MTNSTSTCNGGLIRFIPFSDGDWINQFLLQSFQYGQIQAVIAILCLSLFLFLFLILQLCYKRHKQLKPSTSSSVPSESSSSATSLELHYFKTQDYEWVDDLWQSELKTSRQTRWRKLDSHFEFSSDVDKPRSNHQHISSASEIRPLYKIYNRRIMILSLVSALFVICLVGHVASLVIAIRSQQNLMSNLNALPVQMHMISQNGIEFTRFAMDTALNISKAHILNDAHRSNNASYLQSFVREVKVLVSQVVACLAFDCYDLTGNRTMNLTLLPAENTSQVDLDIHRQISVHLLQSFELAIKRFENLNNAAQQLSPSAIQEIQHAWYEYRRDVSTLVPDNPILTGSVNQQTWASYDWLKQTRNLLCSYLNHSRLEQFESCYQVESYLNQVVKYANQLPYMMPSKRLETVTKFTLIPRALNADQLVNQWMPVLYDLPGKGLVLLLDTFLKPEMNKAETDLKRLSSTFPSNDISNQIILYGRYINSALIITFVLFVTLAVIMCLVYLVLFTRHWKKLHKCHKFLTHWNRRDHSASDFYHLIQTRTGFKSMCPLIGLIGWTLLASILVIISLSLVYSSVLAKLEVCDSIVGQNDCVRQTDPILTKRLEVTASQMPQLVPFLTIDNLELRYPQNILQMLNNRYQNGQKPLLQQIEMTRPVNFTALLEAEWTLDQIWKAWNKDVIDKLEKENLISKIPQINLTQVYEQTAKTLNLADSFDNLQVGPITDYLNDPGPNLFRKLRDGLEQVPTQEAHKLFEFYEELDKRYSNYSNWYANTNKTLDQINENKALLEVINVLIETGSRILQVLSKKTKQELIDLINQFLPVIFPRLKPLGEEYVIPFVQNLLVDLIPYNGLNDIYVQTLQIVCPIPSDQDSHSIVEKPILSEIQTMSISMSSLGISLLFLCLICSILF